MVSRDVPEGSYAIPFNEANVVGRGRCDGGGDRDDGPQGAGSGNGVGQGGIQCEVIDPRTTSLLDLETIIESVENTGRLVVVDI